MKLSQYFPTSRYGDVVSLGVDDLKRGNVGPCQVCGDQTAFWCLFMMPFQACSMECLEELRQREDAESDFEKSPIVDSFL